MQIWQQNDILQVMCENWLFLSNLKVKIPFMDAQY